MAKGIKTGGRQKGSKNKVTVERETGVTELVKQTASEGIMPLEVMLGAMRDAWEKQDKDAAARFAKDAAPYMHPRLAAIEHTGENGGPIKHMHGLAWMTEAEAKKRGWV